MIGDVPKQFISNMENGIRPISKKTALKLAKIFGVSVAKFIG
jgi:plasmid maintenance system antidote protein VapI